MQMTRSKPFYSQWLRMFLAMVVVLPAVARSADDQEGIAYFEKHIRPLLASHCYKCHSVRANRSEGGLLLDSRSGWAVGGERGPALVPGDVESSLLIRAVRYSDDEIQMPPDERLSKEAVAHLEHWVRMGAPDPRNEDTAAASKRLKNPSDPVAGRDHWAFRPLQSVSTPTVQAAEWPTSPIDYFVLAKLEKSGLKPVADAAPDVLVRRIYVQLTGLPPTSEQISEYLADASPDAYERLVDRLLSSPQFGERWGRHWLDLARYADSNGLDENFLFREAWRYRNWVIDAANKDVPFDRFVLEQIAGDLLPYDSIEVRDQQRIAAGFLAIGPKVLLGNDPENQRMEVADEQLDSIGKAILGQTLGCARCHDHKFDPVPTADYYALAGIFTSTQVMEQRYMLGEQRVMEQLIGLGSDGEELDRQYERYWRGRKRLEERVKKAKAALELLEKDDADGFGKIAKEESRAVAEKALDMTAPREERIAAQKEHLAQLAHSFANPPAIPPRAMTATDRNEPRDETIRLAGQFDRHGERVQRGFLRVLTTQPVPMPQKQSGRLELSAWLTDAEHGAGHLAARVLANRLWHHLIGQGIVRTVDNFGRTGEEPTHPELLDYLARELIESNWSVKSLVREIVMSRTFRLSSLHDPASHAVDPGNRLLWRAHRRRVAPEVLRDAMLLAADQLDYRRYDSTVSYLGDQATAVGDNKIRRRTDFPCRSVYLPVIRNDLPELFNVFDFADPHATTGMRPETMVATQGLYLLNDESVMAAAEMTARRVLATPDCGTAEARADQMYKLVFGRLGNSDDRQELVLFVNKVKEQLTELAEEEAELRAWSVASHALFASSRFQILE